MVRLSLETLRATDSRLNPIGERERILRNLRIPKIEHLDWLRDAEEALDLTGNELTELDGFPVMARLHTLAVARNRVARIGADLATSLPNLRVLILNDNRLVDLDDLEPLFRFKGLTTLSLGGNPVARLKNYRQHVIAALPSLTMLDFERVRASERAAAVGHSATSGFVRSSDSN